MPIFSPSDKSANWLNFLVKIKEHLTTIFSASFPKRGFISYAWEQDEAQNKILQDWLSDLRKDLLAIGLPDIFLDIYDMHGNMDEAMRQNIQTSDVVLFIGNPRFKARFEMPDTRNSHGRTNLWFEVDNVLKELKNGSALRPILLLQDGTIPESVPDELLHLPLLDLSNRHLREKRFTGFMDEPGLLPMLYNIDRVDDRYFQLVREYYLNDIPSIASTFFGREKEISDLQKQIEENPVSMLFGAEGVGKSAIATQYASEFKDKYDFVRYLALNKESEWENLISEFSRDLNTERKEFWKALLNFPKWLIIIDNNAGRIPWELDFRVEKMHQQRLLIVQPVRGTYPTLALTTLPEDHALSLLEYYLPGSLTDEARKLIVKCSGSIKRLLDTVKYITNSPWLDLSDFFAYNLDLPVPPRLPRDLKTMGSIGANTTGNFTFPIFAQKWGVAKIAVKDIIDQRSLNFVTVGILFHKDDRDIALKLQLDLQECGLAATIMQDLSNTAPELQSLIILATPNFKQECAAQESEIAALASSKSKDFLSPLIANGNFPTAIPGFLGKYLIRDCTDNQAFSQKKYEDILLRIGNPEGIIRAICGFKDTDREYCRVWHKYHLSNLPDRETKFVGREEFFTEIAKLLEFRAGSVALIGMGGVGKSSLAIKYGQEQVAKYDFVRFINSDNLTFPTSLASLARELDVVVPEGTPLSIFVPKLHAQLITIPSYLLIFDNVASYEVIQEYLPQLRDGQHIIFTSRSIYWPQKLELASFSSEEAQTYIYQEIGVTNIELAEELDYLPLALNSAVSLIKQRRAMGDYDIQSYLSEYRSKKSVASSESNPVFQALQMSLPFIKPSKAVWQVLVSCAFLAPDNIDPRWFATRHLLETMPEVYGALGVLYDYAMLIIRHKKLNIHRLMQEALLESLELDTDEIFSTFLIPLINSLQVIYPWHRATVEHQQLVNKLIPHFISLNRHVDRLTATTKTLSKQAAIAKSSLLACLGDAYGALGDHPQQQKLCEESRDLQIKYNIKEQTYILTLESLSVAYGQLGKVSEKNKVLVEAMGLRQQVDSDKDSLEYLIALENLAISYEDIEKDKAIELFEEVLALKKQRFGTEHFEYALTLGFIGRTYGYHNSSKRDKYLKESIEKLTKIFQKQKKESNFYLTSEQISKSLVILLTTSDQVGQRDNMLANIPEDILDNASFTPEQYSRVHNALQKSFEDNYRYDDYDYLRQYAKDRDEGRSQKLLGRLQTMPEFAPAILTLLLKGIKTKVYRDAGRGVTMRAGFPIGNLRTLKFSKGQTELVLPMLLALIDESIIYDENEAYRYALEALGRLFLTSAQTDVVIATIQEALQHQDEYTRKTAIESLHKLTYYSEHLPLLLGWANDVAYSADKQIRERAGAILIGMNFSVNQMQAVLPLLIIGAIDTNKDIKNHALQVLNHLSITVEHIDCILETFADFYSINGSDSTPYHDYDATIRAMQAVEKFRVNSKLIPEVLKKLLAVLKSDNFKKQEVAAHFLKTLDFKYANTAEILNIALPLLQIDSTSNQKIREQVFFILQKLTIKDEHIEQVWPVFMSVLQSADEKNDNKILIIRKLVELSTSEGCIEEAYLVLFNLVQSDSDYHVRNSALESLAELALNDEQSCKILPVLLEIIRQNKNNFAIKLLGKLRLIPKHSLSVLSTLLLVIDEYGDLRSDVIDVLTKLEFIQEENLQIFEIIEQNLVNQNFYYRYTSHKILSKLSLSAEQAEIIIPKLLSFIDKEFKYQQVSVITIKMEDDVSKIISDIKDNPQKITLLKKEKNIKIFASYFYENGASLTQSSIDKLIQIQTQELVQDEDSCAITDVSVVKKIADVCECSYYNADIRSGLINTMADLKPAPKYTLAILPTLLKTIGFREENCYWEERIREAVIKVINGLVLNFTQEKEVVINLLELAKLNEEKYGCIVRILSELNFVVNYTALIYPKLLQELKQNNSETKAAILRLLEKLPYNQDYIDELLPTLLESLINGDDKIKSKIMQLIYSWDLSAEQLKPILSILQMELARTTKVEHKINIIKTLARLSSSIEQLTENCKTLLIIIKNKSEHSHKPAAWDTLGELVAKHGLDFIEILQDSVIEDDELHDEVARKIRDILPHVSLPILLISGLDGRTAYELQFSPEQTPWLLPIILKGCKDKRNGTREAGLGLLHKLTLSSEQTFEILTLLEERIYDGNDPKAVEVIGNLPLQPKHINTVLTLLKIAIKDNYDYVRSNVTRVLNKLTLMPEHAIDVLSIALDSERYGVSYYNKEDVEKILSKLIPNLENIIDFLNVLKSNIKDKNDDVKKLASKILWQLNWSSEHWADIFSVLLLINSNGETKIDSQPTAFVSILKTIALINKDSSELVIKTLDNFLDLVLLKNRVLPEQAVSDILSLCFSVAEKCPELFGEINLIIEKLLIMPDGASPKVFSLKQDVRTMQDSSSSGLKKIRKESLKLKKIIKKYPNIRWKYPSHFDKNKFTFTSPETTDCIRYLPITADEIGFTPVTEKLALFIKSLILEKITSSSMAARLLAKMILNRLVFNELIPGLVISQPRLELFDSKAEQQLLAEHNYDLFPALKSKNGYIRAQAQERLSKLVLTDEHLEVGLAILLTGMQDKSSDIRVSVSKFLLDYFYILSANQTTKVLSVFIKTAKHHNPNISNNVIKILKQLILNCDQKTYLLKKLLSFLTHNDDKVVLIGKTIFKNLFFTQEQQRFAITELDKMSEIEGLRVQQAKLWFSSRYVQDEFIDGKLKLAYDEKSYKGLTIEETELIVPILIQRIQDTDLNVRDQAATVLARLTLSSISVSQYLPAMLRVIINRDKYIQYNYHGVIVTLSKLSLTADQIQYAVDTLLMAVRMGMPEEKRRAFEALAVLELNREQTALIFYLLTPIFNASCNSYVRRSVLELLNHLQLASAEITQVLNTALFEALHDQYEPGRLARKLLIKVSNKHQKSIIKDALLQAARIKITKNRAEEILLELEQLPESKTLIAGKDSTPLTIEAQSVQVPKNIVEFISELKNSDGTINVEIISKLVELDLNGEQILNVLNTLLPQELPANDYDFSIYWKFKNQVKWNWELLEQDATTSILPKVIHIVIYAENAHRYLRYLSNLILKKISLSEIQTTELFTVLSPLAGKDAKPLEITKILAKHASKPEQIEFVLSQMESLKKHSDDDIKVIYMTILRQLQFSTEHAPKVISIFLNAVQDTYNYKAKDEVANTIISKLVFEPAQTDDVLLSLIDVMKAEHSSSYSISKHLMAIANKLDLRAENVPDVLKLLFAAVEQSRYYWSSYEAYHKTLCHFILDAQNAPVVISYLLSYMNDDNSEVRDKAEELFSKLQFLPEHQSVIFSILLTALKEPYGQIQNNIITALTKLTLSHHNIIELLPIFLLALNDKLIVREYVSNVLDKISFENAEVLNVAEYLLKYMADNPNSEQIRAIPKIFSKLNFDTEQQEYLIKKLLKFIKEGEGLCKIIALRTLSNFSSFDYLQADKLVKKLPLRANSGDNELIKQTFDIAATLNLPVQSSILLGNKVLSFILEDNTSLALSAITLFKQIIQVFEAVDSDIRKAELNKYINLIIQKANPLLKFILLDSLSNLNLENDQVGLIVNEILSVLRLQDENQIEQCSKILSNLSLNQDQADRIIDTVLANITPATAALICELPLAEEIVEKLLITLITNLRNPNWLMRSNSIIILSKLSYNMDQFQMIVESLDSAVAEHDWPTINNFVMLLDQIQQIPSEQVNQLQPILLPLTRICSKELSRKILILFGKYDISLTEYNETLLTLLAKAIYCEANSVTLSRLVEINPPDKVLPLLLSACRDSRDIIRQRAKTLLDSLKFTSEQLFSILPTLSLSLKDSDEEVRINAVQIIERINSAPLPSSLVSIILSAVFRDKSKSVRKYALKILIQTCTKEYLEKILELSLLILNNNNDNETLEALKILAKMPTDVSTLKIKKAIPDLLKILNGHYPKFQLLVLNIFSKIEYTTENENLLLTNLFDILRDDDTDAKVKKAIIDFTKTLRINHDLSESILSVILAAINTKDSYIQRSALNILSQLNLTSQELIQVLTIVLKDGGNIIEVFADDEVFIAYQRFIINLCSSAEQSVISDIVSVVIQSFILGNYHSLMVLNFLKCTEEQTNEVWSLLRDKLDNEETLQENEDWSKWAVILHTLGKIAHAPEQINYYKAQVSKFLAKMDEAIKNDETHNNILAIDALGYLSVNEAQVDEVLALFKIVYEKPAAYGAIASSINKMSLSVSQVEEALSSFILPALNSSENQFYSLQTLDNMILSDEQICRLIPGLKNIITNVEGKGQDDNNEYYENNKARIKVIEIVGKLFLMADLDARIRDELESILIAASKDDDMNCRKKSKRFLQQNTAIVKNSTSSVIGFYSQLPLSRRSDPCLWQTNGGPPKAR